MPCTNRIAGFVCHTSANCMIFPARTGRCRKHNRKPSVVVRRATLSEPERKRGARGDKPEATSFASIPGMGQAPAWYTMKAAGPFPECWAAPNQPHPNPPVRLRLRRELSRTLTSKPRVGRELLSGQEVILSSAILLLPHAGLHGSDGPRTASHLCVILITAIRRQRAWATVVVGAAATAQR